MGGCLSRKSEVKFKGKSKQEPTSTSRPINGIADVEDRIANGENGAANGNGLRIQPHKAAPELPTSSYPRHLVNGDLSENVVTTEHEIDESDDDEEFFDALSEWPSDLETGPEASEIDSHHQTPREPNSEYISHARDDSTYRRKRENGEGDDLSSSSGNRHSKQGHKERPGLFSACLSLVHKTENSEGFDEVDSGGLKRQSSQRQSPTHQDSLPGPDSPKDLQAAGSTLTKLQDESDLGVNSWCKIDSSHFKIRSATYLKNKKKQQAAGSVYEVLTCDVFRSEKKLRHLARALQLPPVQPKSGDISIPQFLIVNVMVPLYDYSFWGNHDRTDGFNAVFVCALKEDEYRGLSPGTKKMLDDCMKDPEKETKGNRTEARDRVKGIPMLRNPQDIELSFAEKKLIDGYNAKPVMARPQVEFYMGENYFEVDLDIHRFGYLCRQGLTSFRTRMPDMVLDFTLVLQGMKPEELPEKPLMSARVLRVDFGGQKQWPWPGACIDDEPDVVS